MPELVHDGDDRVRDSSSSHALLAPQQVRRHPDRVPAVVAHLARDGEQIGRFAQRLASLISIGRLTPVITSTRSISRNVMPRFDGVPPNMSVSSSTPPSPRTRSIACAMSSRASFDVVVPADGDGGELRQIADDHLRGVHQLGGELPVRHDDDADHGVDTSAYDTAARSQDARVNPPARQDDRLRIRDVAVPDPHARAVHIGERATQPLRNHHRAMAPAGAADADRQIALPFRDVVAA